MIPQIIHQIWVGTKPLPKKFAIWGESFRHHLPDWPYHVWGDEQLEALASEHFPRHLDLFRRMTVMSQKADLAAT